MANLIIIFLAICFSFQEKCLGEYCDKQNSSSTFIKTKIESIPVKDRIFLENFFSELIKIDGLGYVLFGSKPICLSGYFMHDPMGNIFMGCGTSLIRKGWSIWKEYEHLFPHPKYLIFKENHVRGDKNIHAIYFINIKNLLKTLDDNRQIFKNELFELFDSEKFAINLKENQSLSELIDSHEGLLGILLGYGVESSMQYYFRDTAWKSFQLTQQKKYNLQPVPVNNFFATDFIRSICFVGDPASEEVKNIIGQNARERSDLQKIYSDGKFLEITLQKLIEE